MASRLSDAERAVRAYCSSVVSGKRIVGRLERLAVERYLADLAAVKSGERTDIRFDRGAAQDVCEFFPLLKHSKGKWAGQRFEPAPWQLFIAWNVFGWKRADGTRRFRVAYVEIARKNGKTTFAAALALYLAFFDGEAGAEVYAVATKKDQARICHAEAVKMSRRVRELGLESGSAPPDKAAAIYSTALGAKLDALGADADTTDGLNVHAAIVDEFHAHKTRDLFDRIDTATGARRQPLILIITTAGDDELSPCYQERERARSMLDATLPDDSLFAFIAAPDEGDDWTARSTWSKGNPNLGVSVQIDELAEQCAKAKRSPQRQNAFRRFRLNQWTRATTRFIDLGAWDGCAGDVPAKSIEEQMEGRVCYSGLDLSSKTDVTALVHVFPPEEGETEYVIVPRFWLPEEAITSPDRPRSVPYEQWVEEGFLRTTPGNVIDYEQVVQEIEEDTERFRIAEMPFDRWGSQLITPKLEGMGLTVVQFGQGFKMMSDPTKELEALVLSKKIRHGGHPVLRWMADCLEVSTDPAGNIKPVKPDTRKSAKRIDGMVALVMALSRAMLLGASPPQDRSIYEDRGMLEL